MAEAQHGYRHTFSATLAKHAGLLLGTMFLLAYDLEQAGAYAQLREEHDEAQFRID